VAELAFPKQNNADPAFLEWCRDKCRTGTGQCILTGEKALLVPHHVRGRRHGDKNNVVLVLFHYHVIANDSYHQLGSYRAFDKLHGTDSVKTAKQLYQQYLSQKE
jgi:hypothetical protein